MNWTATRTVLLLLLPGCALSSPEPSSLDQPELQLRFLSAAEGCGPLSVELPPPGMPPVDAALVRFTVLAEDGSSLVVREHPLDATARCEDDQGHVFACPFDVDSDGSRERQLLIEDLPSEQRLILKAEVEDERGVVRWSGLRKGLELKPGGERLVQLLLTRHAASSCIGGGLSAVFGSATPLDDGRVLLAGGFQELSGSCGDDCFVLSASKAAFLYDPRAALLTPVEGGLEFPRGLHASALLPDGRVVLVGGSEQLELDLSGAGFPLRWEAQPLEPASASTSFEIYNPETRRFEGRGALRESRAGASVAVGPDGKLWVVGGGQRVGDQPGVEGDAARSVEILELSVEAGSSSRGGQGTPALAGRMGARLLRLPGAGSEGPWALIGGSGRADLPVELLRDGELFAPQDAGWTEFSREGQDLPNLLLPLVAPFGDQRSFLVSGGAALEPDAGAHALRWLRSSYNFRVLAADGRLEDLGNGLSPRMLAVALGLPSGRVLVLGGLIEEMGAGGIVVTDATTALEVSGLRSSGPRLRWPRAGHVSVGLSDGGVLTAGGFTLDRDEQGANRLQLQSYVEVLNLGFEL